MLPRRKVLAGNWKMHMTRPDVAPFVDEFVRGCGPFKGWREQIELIFAVPFTLLETVYKFGQMHGFSVAAQNVHWETQGAFTGEVSVAHLRDINVNTTLVGHSERRQYFGETDVTVARKVKACLISGLMPIVCVGETKDERESGRTDAVVSKQLQAIVDSVAPSGEGIIIAYEPVWAIGTGLSATAQQADDVHRLIRSFWANRFSASAAEKLRILYGGSANPQNADSLFAMPNIDGALVGGASLKPRDFASMLGALSK